MNKKYYYLFQVFEKYDPVGNLDNVTTVEVMADNYDEAEKQVRPLLQKNDARNIRLKAIAPVTPDKQLM